MKFQMSFKWKLVVGVMAVIIPLGMLLALVLQSQLANLDVHVFDAFEKQAIAKAIAIQTEISNSTGGEGHSDLKGVLSAFLAREKRDTEQEETRAVFVVDKYHKVLTSAGAKIDLRTLVPKFPEVKKTTVLRAGKHVLAITAFSSDVAGAKYVVFAESMQSYLASKSQVFFVRLGISVIGLLVVALGVYIIGVRSVAPIYALIKTARDIAAGNLEKIEAQETKSLETNELATSITSMANALQKQVVAIKALTTEISGASTEFAGNMSQLASSASEQAAAVTETAATVEEMEQAGKSAAGNAKQIVDAAEKTQEASVRGRDAVETANAIILRIKEDSQDIVDKSRNLLSAVEEVGNIIRSVNAIAEQSKILAVNASIEAAKAGEYGSGFAVVAQEVKDLAQQSKDATLQITGPLTSIRQAIEKMVDTSLSGKERTEEAVSTIANAGAIMNDLSEAIRENSEFANVIATNINQQTVGLTQIATSVDQINSTAYENQSISRKNVEMADQMAMSFGELNTLVSIWQTSDEMASNDDEKDV
ncbi:MAG: methyl-accepting chemotaxis protein [Myxococcota bacterium]|nr:methyl-accepting chemotaxis protein [Myxococcota bacterium]